ncbi:hypothetical protein [Ornithinimicrobium sp. CNJ-824]|uniref:hypothetical protein n=1 Tax=Ornithinimicrobium sp. CNJ-824 TaxID=1904966 RepID=UPI00192CF932|nr:hypothetical protein [Ornithinimicrobium sp. CNJ-824]
MHQVSRRSFLTWTAVGTLALVVTDPVTGVRRVVAEELPGGTLPAGDIRPFASPLLVPPTMPRTRRSGAKGGPVDHYDISVRQFAQQMLPEEHPATTVWGYGPADGGVGRRLHHAPSMTIEAEHGVPVRIRWVNDLVDDQGRPGPTCCPSTPPCTGPTPTCGRGRGRTACRAPTYVPISPA